MAAEENSRPILLVTGGSRGIGAAVASLVGFVTLVIAHNLALGGDTMEMLRAVLDTISQSDVCSTGTLGSYYWEIGDRNGVLVSGSVGAGGVTASTVMNIASASKWLFAAYVFEKHGVSPSRVELEITETTLMMDAERTLPLLDELRAEHGLDPFHRVLLRVAALLREGVEGFRDAARRLEAAGAKAAIEAKTQALAQVSGKLAERLYAAKAENASAGGAEQPQSKGNGKDARSAASASGIEEPYPRLHSQCRERVLPEWTAERLLQFGPVTRGRAPQLALSFPR